jgi:hypothetical protein
VLEAGQKLGTVAGLFTKIDDATIATEIAALDARTKASG